MVNKFKEKRENVRTFLTAQVTVKPVSRHYADGFSGFFTGMEPLLPPSSPKKESVPGTPDSVIGMLLSLDEKLDHILSILEDNKNLAQKRCEALDISGTGLCILMDEEVRFGDNFEVTIRFSGHPLRVLKTCAEVVRVSPYLNNRFEIGMKFKDLTEAEKENIIALTFSENRKRIRENKSMWDND
ncbi:PilZ domain-containing protein [Desulforegula conservatrix]|uniref:PilZ domain-containing protein n=1 Tax=Desulforegula conservatrix TaxID=153026 RepID=UPI0004258E5C|nr:PilZ domain-containing protein [Desulforegula conservatrix]